MQALRWNLRLCTVREVDYVSNRHLKTGSCGQTPLTTLSTGYNSHGPMVRDSDPQTGSHIILSNHHLLFTHSACSFSF